MDTCILYFVVQVSSNVSSVAYHITQYLHIIAQLRARVKSLEHQKKHVWKERIEKEKEKEREGNALCSQLKALLNEEKEIR